MPTTLDDARKAKFKVVKELSAAFNDAARSPVNAIGLSKDKDGYYVSVGLERQPSAAECANLPQDCDGVRVKYKVTGPINAQ